MPLKCEHQHIYNRNPSIKEVREKKAGRKACNVILLFANTSKTFNQGA